MWRKLLLFIALLISFLLIRAPATVWDAGLQHLTKGQLALLDVTGSVWHGQARLSVRDTANGQRIPVTPVSWQWRPLDFLRGRVGWAFSVAGLPPFTLAASPLGISANSVALQLPVRTVLEQIPNTVARAGWHGDFSLNANQWHCNWRGLCDGHAELFWRGAASDLFPNRSFGNYRLAIDGEAGNTHLKLDTLSGEVRLNASGQISAQGAAQIQGSVEGDPAFVGRLPDVAGRWVQRTSDPGRISFSFNGFATANPAKR
ncbi:type II secretion system protein N [Uliginosibacterium sp. H3]|uniref:Type II secretion system protein N n=1 Tax=Uliginosibacterium silvisoli TaxID=3114758 RepID=A0ABU6K8L1_9RHOO|nr:type II secretion system protein N [Uliginosibacterium sp. H3]